MDIKPEEVKIFTVCITSFKKYKALAVFKDGNLVIASVDQIQGNFLSWRAPLIEEVKKRVAEGFIVLVEEKTDYVSGHATQYLLEDMVDDDGVKRSNYFDALDWYFALTDTNNISFYSDCKQYAINASGEGSMVDRQQDDKGRSLYKVDWKRFHGGYRAVLLCVVAAMYEPLSERFLQSMFAMDERATEIPNPAARFRSVLDHFTQQKGRELDELRERLP